MRSKNHLTLIFGLLMLAGIGVSQAQTQITLMQWTNQWRYLVTNALPVGWSASNYPAANGWPLGSAVLAFPADEAMPAGVPQPPANTVLMTNFNSMIVTSFYFRTSITLASPPNQLLITGSAVIDDGAVIYVNGREVQRIRMPAAPAAINHNTLASAGGDVGARIDTFAIASSNFVQGANVIAAEVHQDAHTSSDVVFGMQLAAQLVQPIVITSQPQDQTVDVGLSATFSVTATGTNPRYQWYTNNVLVPLQTNSAFTINATTLAMNGRIVHVVVTNQISNVRSDNAVLTVVADRNGPLMLSAITTASNAFEIRFNENIAAPNATNTSSTNTLNYIVRILGTTNTLVVTQAQWGINLSRLRVSGNFDPNTNYVVCAYNMQDQLGNVTGSDCIGITGLALTNDVFSLASPGWRFADFITDNRMDLTNWTSLSFREDPNDWADGFGIFWFDQVNFNPQCSSLGTGIANFPETQYFRKRFDLLSTFGTGVTARLTYLADDAAVFYINGTEIYRTPNMPQGPVIYSTRPTSAGPENSCQVASPAINGNILRVGSNVFAVELHQVPSEGANNDMVFDAALQFLYRVTPTIPALTIRRAQTTIFVEWVGTGWQLQHAVNPAGSWTNLTSSPVGGSNRYSGNLGTLGPRRFYRLKNP